MADNPIQKLVQLVLDRTAAKRTEDEAKRSLGGIDRTLASVRRTAIALGAAFAATFAVRRIIQFGRESIRVAAEAGVIWDQLAGVIDNVGASSERLIPEIEGIAKAFQAVTTVGDENFAQSLGRLITLTGDAEASLNNMGLIANVAAQFFKGELGPAVDTVARVMNGQTMMLRRMGIQVDSAQEGLEVLAARSMGAAIRAGEGLNGMLMRGSNAWGDFQQAVGNALAGGSGTIGFFDTLTGVIQVMTQWIDDNSAAINAWVTGGFKVLVLVLDSVYQAVKGVTEILTGAFSFAFYGAVKAVQLFSNMMIFASKVKVGFYALFNKQGVPAAQAELKALQEQSDAYGQLAEEMRKAAAEKLKSGFGRFTTPGAVLGTFDQPRPRPELPQNAPMLSRGTGDPDAEKAGEDARKNAEAELKALQDAAQRVTEAMQTPLEKYNATLAELERLKPHLSIETFDRAVQAAGETLMREEEQLRKNALVITDAMSAWEEYGSQLDAIKTQEFLLGDAFDSTAAEVHLLESSIRSLIELGVGPADEGLLSLVDRLEQLRGGTKSVREEMSLLTDIGDEVGALAGAAFGAGINETAKNRARMNAIMAAEQFAHAAVSLLNPATIPKAGGHLAAAGKFTAIATSWAALAGVTGGGSSGGGSGGAGIGRDVGGSRSESIPAPQPDVHIHLTGKGWPAHDVEFQRASAAAQEIARQVYGDGFTYILHPTRAR
jgi:hypothetical protein